eukprot:11161820-Alexandrium_andersonii.AAC.1
MASLLTRAEIEAHKPVDKPLNAMTRPELTLWLSSIEEFPPSTWTTIELRSRIREILKASQTGSKVPTGLANLKKSQLQALCEQQEIAFGQHETKGQLIRKIREKFETQDDMTDHDKVGFGKFAHLTYLELATQHMDYLQWCRDTVEECGLDTAGSMRRL